MNSSVTARLALILFAFISINSIAQHVGKPSGFATVPGYGVSGVTGGAGGEAVLINGQGDAMKLRNALDQDDKPRIIYIKGTVKLPPYTDGRIIPVSKPLEDRMILVRSNKSILGVGNAKIVNSGLSIFSGSGEGNPQDTAVHNIIIQNITFENAPDDNINIQGGAHHVWIDHCTFTDGGGANSGADGQVDIKRGSDFVTVSYCYFTNHYKMCLVGHSNKVKNIDSGHLRVTFDHCYWKDGGGSKTSSRHPRVRFGSVHVLNCLIQGASSDKMCEGVVSQCDAKVWIEGTYFIKCKSGGSTNEHSEGDGYVKNTNNKKDDCGKEFGFGRSFSSTAVFNYSVPNKESPDAVKSTLPGKAGAGKINIKVGATSISGLKAGFTAQTIVPSLFLNKSSTQVIINGVQFNRQDASVNILDFSGRTIINNRLLAGSEKAGYTLDIQDLCTGTYLLKTNHSNSSVISKFNKQ